MAAPHNLSFHSNHTSSEQSLQTPDASSLLLQANNEATPRILANEKGFDSLEELLNDAGVNTNKSTASIDIPLHTKRSLTDSEYSIPTKRFKVDDTSMGVSAGLTRPSLAIPSILSHSSSSNNHIPAITQLSQSKLTSLSLTTAAGTSIPLINPATSSTIPNNIATPLQIGVTSGSMLNTSSSLSNIASLLGSQPPLALGSISLLVQLYKQFQEQGNVQGMQKIKEQLSVLQSQLITKSKSLTGQTGLTGTINITPSLGNSFQPVLIPTLNTLASSSQSLANNLTPNNLSLSNQAISNGPVLNTRPLSNGPSIVTNGVMKAYSSNSVPFLSQSVASAPLSSNGSNTVSSDPLMSGLQTNSLSSSMSSVLPSSTVNQVLGMGTSLDSTNSLNSPGLIMPSLITSSSVSGLPVSSASPSFVTQMTPSSAQLPLGLQVTPQTQANVLKAVYSYRLQQIQDFLSSLPASQKPTTTQELRELLIKNNVLSKALPADFLVQLQKISPQSGINLADTTVSLSQDLTTATVTQSPQVSIPSSTTIPTSTVLPLANNPAHNLTTPTSTVTSIPSSTPTSSSTNSSSSTTSEPTTSSQGNVSLPGVTLETLKTLCRLPQSDFIRIPMPAMLMTIVHFLRSKKWSGSSADLPILLKQAQDALAKNTLTNVTPTPPVVQVTKMSSTASPSLLKSRNKINDTTNNNSSPLSQLMANFGMKGSSSSNHTINSSVTKSSVSSHLKPITRHQTKVYQEQLEKEKIASLQKILQSSEEARIAFRFKAHVDKLNQQLLSPDINRSFTNWQDLILRLLPYHVYREPELPSGAMEKADAVYEGIAGVLLSRSQGLMSRYQQIVVEEEKESGEDRVAGIVLDRLWLEAERERKDEEERQRKEAEEVAAELSVVGGGMINNTTLDSDPFLLDSDSYDDDPFLSQIWGNGLLNQPNDFDIGIT